MMVLRRAEVPMNIIGITNMVVCHLGPVCNCYDVGMELDGLVLDGAVTFFSRPEAGVMYRTFELSVLEKLAML